MLDTQPEFDPKDTLAELLLAPEPSLDALNAALARIGLTGEEARSFLYDTARKINRDTFYPLGKLELLLAEGCDMACSYCFESAILDPSLKRRRLMSDEVITRAVDLLFDHVAEGQMLGLTLFGGEPTLNPRGIRTAIDRFRAGAAERGADTYINMTTNGLHLTPDMMGYLAANNVRVLFSIDGAEASHDLNRKDRQGRGTYARVIANVKAMKAFQPWIGARLTVMPTEAHLLFDNIMALRAEGVNQFIIGPASGVAWSEEESAAFFENWQRLGRWMRETKPEGMRILDYETEAGDYDGPVFGCGAGRGTIAVNVAGEISGCSKIISLESERAVGKLGDVWHGLYMIRARAEMAGCGKLKANCRAAGIEDRYRGGCFANNYEATGDLYMPNMEDFNHAEETARQKKSLLSEG